jgi:hypothetical protein
VDTDTLQQANQGLSEQIDALVAQTAKQQRMLDLCFQLIKEIGHFVPNIIEKFNLELEKIKDED